MTFKVIFKEVAPLGDWPRVEQGEAQPLIKGMTSSVVAQYDDTHEVLILALCAYSQDEKMENGISSRRFVCDWAGKTEAMAIRYAVDTANRWASRLLNHIYHPNFPVEGTDVTFYQPQTPSAASFYQLSR